MSYTADELCAIACTEGHVPQCPRYSRPQTSNDDPAFTAGYPFCTKAGAKSPALEFCKYCHSLEPLHACDTHAMKQRIDDLLAERKTVSGSTSDGYHTFDELYAHRIRLWITVCSLVAGHPLYCADDKDLVWMSAKHSDDSVIDGWFVLGIGVEAGKQITYHLPNSYWAECAAFAVIRQAAPEFDGHTSSDVLKRMKRT